MKRIPKGPLKVIHVNRKAIGENETRSRAVLGGEPRRLVPVVTVWTPLGKVDGFAIRIKGEVRLNYDVTRFTPGFEYGSPDVRCWIETHDAVEIAEKAGEFNDDADTTKDQS